MKAREITLNLKKDEQEMPGVYIGDPCYILPDEFYHEFWGKTHNFDDGAFSTEMPTGETRPVMIVAGTAYGDGKYQGEIIERISDKHNSYNYKHSFYDFGVDSGCLAVVNLEFADPDKIDKFRQSKSLGIIIERPCAGMRLDEDNGFFNFAVLYKENGGEIIEGCSVNIETNDFENEYDETEDENYEDENYEDEY